ncbi:MAG: COP23 domain-containing protein [Xenococcus sp. (in: cyanobacteria)]
MFIRQVFGFSLAITAIVTIPIFSKSVQAQSDKFVCEISPDGIYTTYANTPDGRKPVMRWQSNYFKPPYTPENRCREVTGRFNRFYSQGTLDYLTTGRIKNSNVVCAGLSCDESNVLVTLKPNQQPKQALDQIIANRSGASGPTVQSSGSGSVTFSLDDYLEKTPVEEVGSSGNTMSNPIPNNAIPNGNASPTNPSKSPTGIY